MNRHRVFFLFLVSCLGSVLLTACTAAVVGGAAISAGSASSAVQKSLWANPQMYYSFDDESVIRIEAISYSTNIGAINDHQLSAAYIVGEDMGCKSINLIDNYTKGVPVALDLTGAARRKHYTNYYRCSTRFDDGRKARFLVEHEDLFAKINEKQLLQPATDEMVDEVKVSAAGKHGEASEEIGLAQELLDAHGYTPGPIDGIYGDQTEQALRDYQGDRKLRVTGILDSSTRKSLFGE